MAQAAAPAAPAPPALLQLLPSQGRGGAENYALKIARAALARGWRVTAAFPRLPATESLAADYAGAGSAYLPLAIAPPGAGAAAGAAGAAGAAWADAGRLGHLARLWRVWGACRALRPGVAMVVLPAADRLLGGVLALALAGVPAALVFGLVREPLALSPARLRAYAWARGRGQVLVAKSRFDRELVARSFALPAEDIRVIPNGVAPVAGAGDPATRETARRGLRAELGLPSGAPLWLTVGRLSPQKGLDDLLKALAALGPRAGGASLCLAGEGGERAALAGLAAELRLGGRVRFLGQRGDVARLLLACDLFVLPSRYEGHPNALLEAMAAGAPIVASDASGIAEYLRPGREGLLFPAGNPAALAKTLAAALADPAGLAARAAAARRRAGEFTMARMENETLGLLADLAAGRWRGNPQ